LQRFGLFRRTTAQLSQADKVQRHTANNLPTNDDAAKHGDRRNRGQPNVRRITVKIVWKKLLIAVIDRWRILRRSRQLLHIRRANRRVDQTRDLLVSAT